MSASTIKFGTDGWRAIIADRFTTDNVARLSQGVAAWLGSTELPQRVVMGCDCRFAGELFMEVAARVFTAAGIEVLWSDAIITTPMISMASRDLGCGAGIMFTASHNAPTYHGYKLKTHLGGPMGGEVLKEIEAQIPDDIDHRALPEVKVQKVNVEGPYMKAIQERFDMEALRSMAPRIVYDAMYGSGQFVMKRLFPEMKFFRAEHNPHFHGLSPEPVARNLSDLSEFIKGHDDNLDLAIITDGDADRIGMMDGSGEVVDSHHIIALLTHYLCRYEERQGKVVTAFSTVDAVQRLCAHYDLPFHVVKIGFKYASAVMVDEPVMLAGEESGGIADPAHIPERDGIWIALTLLEAIAKTGKSLQELIGEVYDLVGEFRFLRMDLQLAPAHKNAVVSFCQDRKVDAIGDLSVQRTEDMDGWKFRIDADAWVMVRPSGTEPVLRVYVQAPDTSRAQEIMNSTQQWIQRFDDR